MIQMVLTQRHDGMDLARCAVGEQEFTATSRHGVTMALARQLIAAGVSDQAFEVVGANGKLRFSGPSIENWAGWTISESDRGIHRRRFVAKPEFE